jgi:hypothetical protein
MLPLKAWPWEVLESILDSDLLLTVEPGRLIDSASGLEVVGVGVVVVLVDVAVAGVVLAVAIVAVVAEPVGDKVVGGGSGSGFPRLSCKLRLRTCCGRSSRDCGSGAVATAGEVEAEALRASLEGALVTRVESSREGIAFLKPR